MRGVGVGWWDFCQAMSDCIVGTCRLSVSHAKSEFPRCSTTRIQERWIVSFADAAKIAKMCFRSVMLARGDPQLRDIIKIR